MGRYGRFAVGLRYGLAGYTKPALAGATGARAVGVLAARPGPLFEPQHRLARQVTGAHGDAAFVGGRGAPSRRRSAIGHQYFNRAK
jgi:hypothetical protein